MKVGGTNNLLPLILLLLSGFGVNSLSYDYSASNDCLMKPQKPQYGGGIITNADLNDGLNGWSNFGNGKIEHREYQGNKFIVAHTRNQPYDSVSQKLYLQKDHIYTFSAWIRVSVGNKVAVTTVVKTTGGSKQVGSIIAKSNCWSFLKGGLTVDSTGPAELYFECKDTSAEILVDSISLQPFTQNQWKSHQLQSIQKARYSKVKIKVVDSQGSALENATLVVRRNIRTFPFGCVMNKEILTDTAYRDWFASRGFTVTTFGNEMKWYTTEPNPNSTEDYSSADAMLSLSKRHGLSVRGHNVFWDDPNYQPYWVKTLDDDHGQLSAATKKRLASVMSRYEGQLVAWDVVNENLHFSFFEDKLGKNASAVFYNWALGADPGTTMFMNEYNTIEEAGDVEASPSRYVEKVREILGFRGNENLKMGIGLESHFGSGAPNLGYVRSGIDVLAATGLPIWITELDVKSGPYQAQYLEQLLREVYSHPAITGIVVWAGIPSKGCSEMCLTDQNFINLPTGDVVDKLLHEWGFKNDVVYGNSDASGYFEASLFHGQYEMEISYPNVIEGNFNSLSKNLSVEPKVLANQDTSTVLIQLHA